MPATGSSTTTLLLVAWQCIAGVCCGLNWQDRPQGGAAAESSGLQSPGRGAGE